MFNTLGGRKLGGKTLNYVYSRNNPVNLKDPSGYWEIVVEVPEQGLIWWIMTKLDTGLPSSRGAGGVTAYPFIFIIPAAFPPSDIPKVMAHERVHLAQQRREGLLFLPNYLYYNRTVGYDNNPYEVEAKTISGY